MGASAVGYWRSRPPFFKGPRRYPDTEPALAPAFHPSANFTRQFVPRALSLSASEPVESFVSHWKHCRR